MVAVGLSPRTAVNIRSGVAERRLNGQTGRAAFNRRSATGDHKTPGPWTEVHGYHHSLAPRGLRGHVKAAR